ncbi:MAG: TetR/AcrR family transcriptional regulator [Actinobacteria bacterium]|nr:TetR/AcrR family transcriptional regulator [Actinomycetota bacterium]
MKTSTEPAVKRGRGRPRSDEVREATRRRILDAALTVFSDAGYHGSSVDDVVRASGLSKGGFYFHFPSKEALFSALYDECANQLYERAATAAAGEPEVLDRLAAGVREFLRACYERRSAKLIFAEAAGMNPVLDRKREETMSRFAAMVQTELEEAMSTGTIPQMNARVLSRALVGAFSELGMEVMRSKDLAEVEEVADVLVDVICFMSLSAVMTRRAFPVTAYARTDAP